MTLAPKRPVALVTGSTSGIGFEIAQRLARGGYHIVMNGLIIGPENDQTLKEWEKMYGIRTFSSQADLSNPVEIKKMVDSIEASLGMPDILVCNAGIQHVEAIETFPVEKWNQILAINLSAAFHLTQALFPHMKKQKWGRIVNIASAHAMVGSPFKSAYVAAKHGLAGLTKVMALEGAEYGITCNALCPGYVKTPLVDRQIPEIAKARGISCDAVVEDVLLASQPMKEFIDASAVAEFVWYLTQESARALTGAILPLDGGWTAR